MDLHLTGKVAMVAAASRGLGYGIARALAREGARVSIASRGEAAIQQAAEQLRRETGAQVTGSTADVADAGAITRWAQETIAREGGVDCLVTNAGGPPVGRFDDLSDADWQAAVDLTLLSAVRLIRAVLPSMRRRGGGAILMLTSTTVREPVENLLLSNVLRSGVASLAKSLARQLGPEGIRVNNLMPGRIATDRIRALDEVAAREKGIHLADQQAQLTGAIPLGRYGTPDEFGNAAAFLLSDAAAYITGETLVVDGGALRSLP